MASVRRGSVGTVEPGHWGWSWTLRSNRPAHRAGSWNDEPETGAEDWPVELSRLDRDGAGREVRGTPGKR